MARQNRQDVFNPLEVSTVHCIQRAVRRAMLCGYDPLTQRDYEHRRGWLRDRLQYLAGHYGIDILGYSIMGNHLHVILRNRPDVVATWSDLEIARRIWNLFPKRKESDGSPSEPKDHELKGLVFSNKEVEKYRTRLSDVSWLMRQLAEKIARDANQEDRCTGRFWEGRFKCQPLLDEASLLACATYVDLNPVRAGMAKTPESSDYTSIQDRIKAELGRVTGGRSSSSSCSKIEESSERDNWLSPVPLKERGVGGPHPSKTGRRASDKGFLPFSSEAYMQLVDWTGRQLSQGKRGKIPSQCEAILKRVGFERQRWCELVGGFGRLFRRVAGSRQSLTDSAESKGQHHHQSSGGAELLSSAD